MSRSKRRPEAGEGDDPVVAARQTALGLLARREHSRRELARKLAQRGYDPQIVDPLLSALIAEGLLSEERFAEGYVYVRSARGYGPLRIRAELRERGVPEELVDSFLDDRDPQWADAVAAVHRKRFGADRPSDFRERVKQARFLQQRGFTPEQIRRVLNDPD
ncbi:MAG: regulatory protein RecX [Gammaproteobacteria bacterium]